MFVKSAVNFRVCVFLKRAVKVGLCPSQIARAGSENSLALIRLGGSNEQTFCFSCKRLPTLCKEMYEKLARIGSGYFFKPIFTRIGLRILCIKTDSGQCS